MKRLVVLSLVGLAACGVSEKKFESEYVAKSCELMVECPSETSFVNFESAADCEAFLGAFFSLGTSGCDYDGGKAKECLSELNDATCESGGGSGPSACGEVYSGGSCGWASTSTTGGFTSTGSTSQ